MQSSHGEYGNEHLAVHATASLLEHQSESMRHSKSAGKHVQELLSDHLNNATYDPWGMLRGEHAGTSADGTETGYEEDEGYMDHDRRTYGDIEHDVGLPDGGPRAEPIPETH